jgi:hypothetical protein
VLAGARPRGSGATSPAPRIAGTGEVIRAGFAGRSANRSDDGSAGATFRFCTNSINSLTAVDSVFPIAGRIANALRTYKRNPMTGIDGMMTGSDTLQTRRDFDHLRDPELRS